MRKILKQFLAFCIITLVPFHAFSKTYNLDIAYKSVNITGNFVKKIAINGTIPGPILRFVEGEEVEIVEYPMPDNKYKAMVKQLTTMRSKDYKDLLPEKIAEEFEALDIIPILLDDEIQMIIPYHITIE